MQIDTGRTWREFFDGWRDAITGPQVLVVAAMGLCVRGLADLDASPDTSAVLTGVAAIVSAFAAVIEARRGREQAHIISDHEARLRVLEDRAKR